MFHVRRHDSFHRVSHPLRSVVRMNCYFGWVDHELLYRRVLRFRRVSSVSLTKYNLSRLTQSLSKEGLLHDFLGVSLPRRSLSYGVHFPSLVPHPFHLPPQTLIMFQDKPTSRCPSPRPLHPTPGWGPVSRDPSVLVFVCLLSSRVLLRR